LITPFIQAFFAAAGSSQVLGSCSHREAIRLGTLKRASLLAGHETQLKLQMY
jgi:hypothetical protein